MAATGATAVALAPFTRPRIQPDVVARSPPTTGVRFASHTPSLPTKDLDPSQRSVSDHRKHPCPRALTGPPSPTPECVLRFFQNRAGNRPGRLHWFTRPPS